MKALFSYILSTMAGLCLVGGIAVLCGILLSAALLFGGLAITVVTIQTDEEEYEDE